MTRGYVIPAIDFDKTELLINSLRISQENPDISVLVPNKRKVPVRIKNTADKIIHIPDPSENMLSWYGSECNTIIAYDFTPYDETIVFTDDILIPNSLEYLWELCEKYPLLCVTSTYEYTSNRIKTDPTRIGFMQNRLPDVHTSMMYFKKCDITETIFSACKVLADNWTQYRRMKLQGDIGYHPMHDAVMASAIKETGYIREVYRKECDWFTFADMKIKALNVKNVENMNPDWVSQIDSYLKPDGSLTVGQYLQNFPFRYHMREFIKPYMLEMQRRQLDG